MKDINKIISEIGISKVRLAKYLGVSRQMLYNYLALDSLKDWPKEKSAKLFSLLNIEKEEDMQNLVIDGNYIVGVEERIIEGVKSGNKEEVSTDLRGFNKKEQSILTDIINLLKEKLANDKSKDTYYTYTYLYHFLQTMDNNEELKYILAYLSKSLGFSDPMEFVFNKEKQFVFESILFSAFTLYNNGDASKTKIGETHKRFVQDIKMKKEEKLSRTQELNTAKIQALKELGYTEITEKNAKEVLEKIAEIQARKV